MRPSHNFGELLRSVYSLPSSIQPQLTRAVAERVLMYAHAIEHRQIEIGQGRILGELQMAAGFQAAAAFSRQQNRQLVVVVAIAVADGRAVQNHRIVEQRSRSFGHRLQLAEQIAELCQVETIDGRDLLLFLLVPAVMRQVVVSFRNFQEAIAAVAPLVGKDEG